MEKAIGIQIKPVGNVCNIACKYCYARPFLKKYQLMSIETVETLVRKMCSYQKNLLFTWHGGEPLLPGLDFYKKVMDIIEKYSDGHEIKHVVQTNGTLIDKDFAHFLLRINLKLVLAWMEQKGLMILIVFCQQDTELLTKLCEVLIF